MAVSALPSVDILVEAPRFVEHLLHISHSAYLPRSEWLVERQHATEELPHVRHLTHVPGINVLVKGTHLQMSKAQTSKAQRAARGETVWCSRYRLTRNNETSKREFAGIEVEREREVGEAATTRARGVDTVGSFAFRHYNAPRRTSVPCLLLCSCPTRAAG